MSKRQILMILGVWTIILPYLGFPGDWRKSLAIITGVVIVFVAYRLKPDSLDANGSSGNTLPFTEHRNE